MQLREAGKRESGERAQTQLSARSWSLAKSCARASCSGWLGPRRNRLSSCATRYRETRVFTLLWNLAQPAVGRLRAPTRSFSWRDPGTSWSARLIPIRSTPVAESNICAARALRSAAASWPTNAPHLTRPTTSGFTTKYPFVIAKCGMSLDGRLSPPPNESRWITSAGLAPTCSPLRSQVDAILIGAETVRADNPRLTVRGIRGARQPWRIVLSHSGSLPRRISLRTASPSERSFTPKDARNLVADLGKKR